MTMLMDVTQSVTILLIFVIGQEAAQPIYSLTFSSLYDSIGRVLCTADNSTLSIWNAMTTSTCLNYCVYNVSGCAAYSYYENVQRCDVFTYVPRNYIVVQNCISYRLDKYNPYSPPAKIGGCMIQLQSWGYIDTPLPSSGSITLNGATAVNTGCQNSSGSYSSLLGVVTSILNFENCTLYGTQSYDISSTAGLAQNLVNNLQALNQGLIVLGVTASEPYDNLASIFPYLNSLGINVNTNNLNAYGKFAFVMQVGSPQKTVFSSRLGGGPALPMYAEVYGSSLTDVIINFQ